MDLIALMTGGVDPEEQALDRLEGIVALYESDDAAVQDEALARAISLCGKQWGGYRGGLEALAARKESRTADPVGGALEGMRLREEAEDPGMLIRTARWRREAQARQHHKRDEVIARLGGEAAAKAPSALERPFIEAVAPLMDGAEADPFAPIAGWALVWHDLPPALRQAVSAARPLPATVSAARQEALLWEQRREEYGLLFEGPGSATLPTACAARHRVVEDLWRRDCPVTTPGDLEARLEFWASRGGDDGAGYATILADLRSLMAKGSVPVGGGESTRDKARRLKSDNPDWSLARIGKELGISRQAVHKHLR